MQRTSPTSSSPPPGIQKKPLNKESKTNRVARRSFHGFMDPTHASRAHQRKQTPSPAIRTLSPLSKKPHSDSALPREKPPSPIESISSEERKEPSREKKEAIQEERRRIDALLQRSKKSSARTQRILQKSQKGHSLEELPRAFERTWRQAAEKGSQRVLTELEKFHQEHPIISPTSSSPIASSIPPSIPHKTLLKIFDNEKQDNTKLLKEMKARNDHLSALLEQCKLVEKPQVISKTSTSSVFQKKQLSCLNIHNLLQLLRKSYNMKQGKVQGYDVPVATIDATYEEFQKISSHFANASELDLQFCGIDDEHLHDLCEILPVTLESASLLICPSLTASGLRALYRFSQLKSLVLDASGSITSQGIATLLLKCSDLQKIALFGTVVDDLLSTALSQSKLTKLYLSRSKVSMEVLHKICTSSHLERLILEKCLIGGRQMTASEMQNLQQKHPNIIIIYEETALIDPPEVIASPLTTQSLKKELNESSSYTVAENPSTGQMMRLETLSATPEHLATLIFPHGKLHLAGCNISNEHLQAIDCPNLETALIYDCPHIGDAGFAHIQNLKRFGTNVPLQKLEAIIKSSPELKHLSISGDSLTKQAALAISQSHIQTLDIHFPERILPETIVAAIPQTLEKLTLFGLCNFSKEQFQQLPCDIEVIYADGGELERLFKESAEEDFSLSPEPLLSETDSPSLSYNSQDGTLSRKRTDSGETPIYDEGVYKPDPYFPPPEDPPLPFPSSHVMRRETRSPSSEEEEKTPIEENDAGHLHFGGRVYPSSQMPLVFFPPPLLSHDSAQQLSASRIELESAAGPGHLLFLQHVKADAETHFSSLGLFPFFHEFAKTNLEKIPKAVLKKTDFQSYLPTCNRDNLIFFYQKKLQTYGISLDDLHAWPDPPALKEQKDKMEKFTDLLKQAGPNSKIPEAIPVLDDRIKESEIIKLESITQAAHNLASILKRRHTKLNSSTKAPELQDLSIEQFTELPAKIRDFTILHLSGLKLTWIPGCIASAMWTTLEEIHFENNLLFSLPERCFFLAPKIKTANFSNNRISGISDDFGMFWPSLLTINLQSNEIRALSPTLKLLEGQPLPNSPTDEPVQSLFDLRGNPIKTLPSSKASNIIFSMGPIENGLP